jgi:predicted amidophosphoribosyltransferase
MAIPVERVPLCYLCKVELDYMDDFVVSWQFRCPVCSRAFQVTGRHPKQGWEKVDATFIYSEARHPSQDRELIWLELPRGYEEF